MRFVALDFETTGTVQGLPDEPWQLGMVVVEDGAVLPDSQWETYFCIPADRPFSSRAPGRWAQIRGELASAPAWADRWESLCERLVGVPLVAHNAATERRILTNRAPLAPLGPWYDTLKLVRRLWPAMKSHALGDVIATFGLADRVNAVCPGRTWHDALYDACACAVLLAHLLSEIKGLGPGTLRRYA